MYKRTRKIGKFNTMLLLFYVDMRKKLKATKAMDIISSPKVGRSLPKPSGLLSEALVCEKLIPKPAPNGTKNLPRHVDAAP